MDEVRNFILTIIIALTATGAMAAQPLKPGLIVPKGKEGSFILNRGK